MTTSVKRILLVDGHNLLWRATFGFPARIRSAAGDDITGIFGFFALMRVGWREYGSSAHVVVCFDGQNGLTARRELEPGYKVSRQVENVAPMKSLTPIKRALDLSSIRWIELPDHEADDVIGSLVGRLGGYEIAIMSTDRDYYQLISDSVVVLNTCKKPGSRFVTSKEVQKQFGILPRQWCDFKALTGDSADDINGVSGIGVKTAAKLLKSGSRLEDIQHTTDRLGITIRNHWLEVLTARELIRLRTTVDVPALTLLSVSEMPQAAAVVKTLGLW